jgi:cell wall-associated NlpC family hydrolase
VVQSLQPLDLLLWNKHEDAYGAHVGVYIGDGEAVHLSKEIGYPVLTPVDDFPNNPLYRVFIGAKQVKQQP